MICKSCGKFKHKIKSELRPDGVSYHYRDEAGRPWKGRTCPPCASKNVMHARKLASTQDLGLRVRPQKNIRRKCRKCSELLTSSRYFHCEKCTVGNSSEGQGFYTADDWGYGSVNMRGF